MHTYTLALIGFGNVGQGFAQILKDRGEELAHQYDVSFVITAVSDMLKGSIYDPNGLSPADLLKAVQSDQPLDQLKGAHSGWDALRTIRESQADVMVETTFTDLRTAQPATSHIETAIKEGMHVVTSNKGPVALHWPELSALAAQHGVELGVEGTVMSGTPTLRLGREALAGTGIHKIQGILNGTTNYILTRMENGDTYAAALAQAQQLGYAEADPSGDVEGFDAAGKLIILAALLMNARLTMDDLDRQGITALTPQDIKSAQMQSECWKLIALLEKTPQGIKASVKPTRLPKNHPLAGVSGATNAITYSTVSLGDVTLIGAGAGRLETGSALLEDLLAIHRKSQNE